MKKFFLGIFAVVLIVAVSLLLSRSVADAETKPVAGSSESAGLVAHGPASPVYLSGVWRDGKAVFSDIAITDIFMKPSYRRGYRPEQPIRFNHQRHMEKNQMECQYCHSGVTKSGFATLPSVDLCMGCHKNVKTDSEEIKKLKDYHDRKEPVPWVSVNNLPEHVRFNHKRHLKAGVACQNCHGQVQKMEVVEKVSSLKMGFCVSCHRENGATIDCSACHY